MIHIEEHSRRKCTLVNITFHLNCISNVMKFMSQDVRQFPEGSRPLFLLHRATS